MRKLLIAAALVVATSMPTGARALDLTFCYDVSTQFSDNIQAGTNSIARWPGTPSTVNKVPMNGAAISLYWWSGSSWLYFGWTYLDRFGCTIELSGAPSGTYLTYVHTYGYPGLDGGAGTNQLFVYGTNNATSSTWVTHAHTSSGSFDMAVADFELHRVYATTAKSLKHLALGESGNAVDVRLDISHARCGGCGAPCSSSDTVCLRPDTPSTSDTTRKFVIAHEIGHTVLYWSGGDPYYNCDYPGGTPAGAHALDGKEYVDCAIGEGYADYAATTTWNSAYTNARGYLSYWGWACGVPAGTPIDMEYAFVTCLVPTLSPLDDGYSTEIDFARTLWDFRTNSGWSGFIPTEQEIRDMFSAAPFDASYQNSFDNLLRGAKDNFSGCGMYDRLEELGDANGVICLGSCPSCP